MAAVADMAAAGATSDRPVVDVSKPSLAPVRSAKGGGAAAALASSSGGGGGGGATTPPPSGSSTPIILDGGTGSTPVGHSSGSGGASPSAADLLPTRAHFLTEDALRKGCVMCQIRWRKEMAGEAPPPPVRKRGSLCLNRRVTVGYTRCDVALHDRADDCWFYAHDVVYDATPFITMHPGGPKSLINRAGRDATVDFDFHSGSAQRLWREYEVGHLEGCAAAASAERSGSCAVQ
jgi:hypothetical protein